MLVEIFSWEQTQFILIAKQYIEAGIVDEATKECISAKFGQVVVGINNEIHNLKSLFYRIEVADQQIALPSCSIPVSNRLSKAISREFRYYSSGKKWVNRFSKSIGKIPNGTCPDDSMGHFVHVIHTGTFLGSVYAIARRSMEGSVDVVFHQSFNGEVHRHVMASRAGMGNDSKFPSSPLPPYINFDHSSGKFFLTLPAPMFAINYMEVSAIESFSLE